jgi:hypothetical protein
MSKKFEQNATVLANAAELGAAIMRRIAGNAVSNHIDGQLQNDGATKGALVAVIQRKLTKKHGVV